MKNILSLLMFLITFSSYAETKEEQRIWLGIFARKNIAMNYDLWVDAQLRHDVSNQTMNQTVNRFGIIKQLGEKQELGFLFAYAQTGLVKEYRPTLHYIYKDRWKTNLLSFRSRLEVRDIENEDATSIRYRSHFRFAHPVNSKYELVIWDELFLNMTHETWTGDRLIERNRAFAGLRIYYEKLNFEVGYMNQYIPRGPQDLSEHILTFNLLF